jgi:hypothetical protein
LGFFRGQGLAIVAEGLVAVWHFNAIACIKSDH